MNRVSQSFLHGAGMRMVNEQNRLGVLFQSYRQACESRFIRERTRFEKAASGVALLNPFNILKRGYSVSYKMPERIILKDAKQVKPGDEVKIQLSKSEINTRVMSKEV